jgi:hypothetical protein
MLRQCNAHKINQVILSLKNMRETPFLGLEPPTSGYQVEFFPILPRNIRYRSRLNSVHNSKKKVECQGCLKWHIFALMTFNNLDTA